MQKLINLPYSPGELTPHLNEETVNIHYGKHHQGYVEKLNKHLQGSEFEDWSLRKLLTNLEKLPGELKTPVRNNAGGIINHNLYFKTLSSDGREKPEGRLLEAIVSDFGSFEEFKEELTEVAGSHFGSGWAFLTLTGTGELSVYSTGGHDSPLLKGDEPILTIDVWEHAYYLQYKNRRDEYINAWWEIVDWEKAEERFSKIIKN